LARSLSIKLILSAVFAASAISMTLRILGYRGLQLFLMTKNLIIFQEYICIRTLFEIHYIYIFIHQNGSGNKTKQKLN